MLTVIENKRNPLWKRIVCSCIAVTFSLSLILPPQVSAQMIPQTNLNLPVPGAMINQTPGYTPVLINGIKVHPDNPLKFNFFVHTGDTGMAGPQLSQESTKLIKYFLAGLTVPEKEMWVNLSPYEKDKIVTQKFGDTEMGRDLLAQDYMLKQLTASMMYPEKELGKKFWERVYAKAQKKYGTTDIPMNTFNKIWIVPQEARIYEHDNSAFLIDSKLKVMLEEDFLALNKSLKNEIFSAQDVGQKDARIISGINANVVKDVLIPEIEKEVNQGEIFANLRQIYNAVILSSWYKKNIHNQILSQIYVDQGKTKGIDTQDKKINQKIYDQYVRAFKKGVYNYIKKEYDNSTREIVNRKYFSGGVTTVNVGNRSHTFTQDTISDDDAAMVSRKISKAFEVETDLLEASNQGLERAYQSARHDVDTAMATQTTPQPITLKKNHKVPSGLKDVPSGEIFLGKYAKLYPASYNFFKYYGGDKKEYQEIRQLMDIMEGTTIQVGQTTDPFVDIETGRLLLNADFVDFLNHSGRKKVFMAFLGISLLKAKYGVDYENKDLEILLTGANPSMVVDGLASRLDDIKRIYKLKQKIKKNDTPKGAGQRYFLTDDDIFLIMSDFLFRGKILEETRFRRSLRDEEGYGVYGEISKERATYLLEKFYADRKDILVRTEGSQDDNIEKWRAKVDDNAKIRNADGSEGTASQKVINYSLKGSYLEDPAFEDRYFIWDYEVEKADEVFIGGKSANLGEILYSQHSWAPPAFYSNGITYQELFKQNEIKDFVPHMRSIIDRLKTYIETNKQKLNVSINDLDRNTELELNQLGAVMDDLEKGSALKQAEETLEGLQAAYADLKDMSPDKNLRDYFQTEGKALDEQVDEIKVQQKALESQIKSYKAALKDEKGKRLSNSVTINDLETNIQKLENEYLTRQAEYENIVSATAKKLLAANRIMLVPPEFKNKMKSYLKILADRLDIPVDELSLAIRSSMAGEDSEEASFAGRQDSYFFRSTFPTDEDPEGLNAILYDWIFNQASLFNKRSIDYRVEIGLPTFDKNVRISTVFQDMFLSEIAFTTMSVERVSGMPLMDIQVMEGQGDIMVSGTQTGGLIISTYDGTVLSRVKGDRTEMFIETEDGKGRMKVKIPPEIHKEHAITDEDLIIKSIEYFKKLHDFYGPQGFGDFEGAWRRKRDQNGNPIPLKDNAGNVLLDKRGKPRWEWVIVSTQARPETVHSLRNPDMVWLKKISVTDKAFKKAQKEGLVLPINVAANINGTAQGEVVHILDKDPKTLAKTKGKIMLTEQSDPDMDTAMRKAKGVLAHRGGKNSHTMVVASEYDLVAMTGFTDEQNNRLSWDQVLEMIPEGTEVTIDAVRGKILLGTKHELEVSGKNFNVKDIKPAVSEPDEYWEAQGYSLEDGWRSSKVMRTSTIVGTGAKAFLQGPMAKIPSYKGIGLERIEIALASIGIYTEALLEYDNMIKKENGKPYSGNTLDRETDSQGIVSIKRFDELDISLPPEDVANILITNEWAEQINKDEIRITADIIRDKVQIAKAFEKDDFAPIYKILEEAPSLIDDIETAIAGYNSGEDFYVSILSEWVQSAMQSLIPPKMESIVRAQRITDIGLRLKVLNLIEKQYAEGLGHKEPLKELKKMFDGMTDNGIYQTETDAELLHEIIGLLDKGLYVRLDDLKSDEYGAIKAANRYINEEDNPMAGDRGLGRMLKNEETMDWQLEALKKAAESNISKLNIFAPVVRSPEQVKELLRRMDRIGLTKDLVKRGIMTEIPTNVVNIEDFLATGIDFISTGGNDLLQTMGSVDRLTNNKPLQKSVTAYSLSILRANAILGAAVQEYNRKHGTDIEAGFCGNDPSVQGQENYSKILSMFGYTSVSVILEAYERVANLLADEDLEVAEEIQEVLGFQLDIDKTARFDAKPIDYEQVDIADIRMQLPFHYREFKEYDTDLKTRADKNLLSGEELKRYREIHRLLTRAGYTEGTGAGMKYYRDFITHRLNTILEKAHQQKKHVVIGTDDGTTRQYRKLKWGENHEQEESNPIFGGMGLVKALDVDKDFFETDIRIIDALNQKYRDSISVVLRRARNPKEIKQAVKLFQKFNLDVPYGVDIQIPGNLLEIDEIIEAGADFISLSRPTELVSRMMLLEENNANGAKITEDDKRYQLKRPVDILATAANKAEIPLYVDPSISIEPITDDTAMVTTADLTPAQREEMQLQTHRIRSYSRSQLAKARQSYAPVIDAIKTAMDDQVEVLVDSPTVIKSINDQPLPVIKHQGHLQRLGRQNQLVVADRDTNDVGTVIGVSNRVGPQLIPLTLILNKQIDDKKAFMDQIGREFARRDIGLREIDATSRLREDDKLVVDSDSLKFIPLSGGRMLMGLYLWTDTGAEHTMPDEILKDVALPEAHGSLREASRFKREPLERTMNIFINGANGRIGSIDFGKILRFTDPKDIQVVAVNGTTPEKFVETLYTDSVHGATLRPGDTVRMGYDKDMDIFKTVDPKVGNYVEIKLKEWDRYHRVYTFNVRRATKELPIKRLRAINNALNIDIAIDATGQFKERSMLESYTKAGMKKVVFTAPTKDKKDPSNVAHPILIGVNDEIIPMYVDIFDIASCTTNSIAAMYKAAMKGADQIRFESELVKLFKEQSIDSEHEIIQNLRKQADYGTIGISALVKELIKAEETGLIESSDRLEDLKKTAAGQEAREWVVEAGSLMSAHSSTSSNKAVDTSNRKARGLSAYLNIILTSTGAANAVAVDKVLPELQGKFIAYAVRIPLANSSLGESKLVITLPEGSEELTAKAFNDRLRAAAETEQMKGTFAVEDGIPSVAQIQGRSEGGIVFSQGTQVTRIGDSNSYLVTVLDWYDNEWGYAGRPVDALYKIGQNIIQEEKAIKAAQNAYRVPVFGGNIKQQFMRQVEVENAILEYAQQIQQRGIDPARVEVFLAFQDLYLSDAVSAVRTLERSGKLEKGFIQIAAQDVRAVEGPGEYTAFEAAAQQLKETGVTHVIIGHSETRAYKNLTDEDINARRKAIKEAGLIPVVCCGESAEERANEEQFNVIRRQILGAFKGASAEDVTEDIIAYEPIWAIGKNALRQASNAEAEEMLKYIRTLLVRRFGPEAAGQVRLLYGGSVKPQTAAELIALPNLDGGLVGGASKKGKSGFSIVKHFAQIDHPALAPVGLEGLPEAIKELTLDQVKGKRVLIGVNLNVGIEDDGTIPDQTRMGLTRKIINHIAGLGGNIVLLAHNGRYDPNPAEDTRHTLKPVAEKFAQYFPHLNVVFHDNSINNDVGVKITPAELDATEARWARENTQPVVHVIEGVRWAPDFENAKKGSANRVDFGQSLARLGDGIYVVDRFGDIGSKGALSEDLPIRVAQQGGKVYIGPEMANEYQEVMDILDGGFQAIVFGGAKPEKVNFLKNLATQALAEDGFALMGSGPSVALNNEMQATLEDIRLGNPERILTAEAYRSPDNTLDISDQDIDRYIAKLDTLNTGDKVLINGTMGKVEEPGYEIGTEKIFLKLKQLAEKKGVNVVVIGGDASKNARKYGLDQIENVRIFSGGGVVIKILSNEPLVGIRALRQAVKISDQAQLSQASQLVLTEIMKNYGIGKPFKDKDLSRKMNKTNGFVHKHLELLVKNHRLSKTGPKYILRDQAMRTANDVVIAFSKYIAYDHEKKSFYPLRLHKFIEDERGGLDKLIEIAALHHNTEVKKAASRMIMEVAESAGIYSTSIHEPYTARKQGKILQNTTLPANNIRGLTYKTMQTAFKTIMKHDGVASFELAKSERKYTDQPLWEYAASVYAAALKTVYRGPIFLQLDHLQVNKELYFGLNGKEADPQKAMQELKDLIDEAFEARMFNIDIDPSPLMVAGNLKAQGATLAELQTLGLYDLPELKDHDLETLTEEEILLRQTFNIRETANLVKYIRDKEKEYGLPFNVGIGGEDMHVDQNVFSTLRSVKVYAQAVEAALDKKGIAKGRRLIKISVQTGTGHGGITVAGVPLGEETVQIDLNALAEITRAAERGELGSTIAGAVQHGASTVPEKYFEEFVQNRVIEVHLATGYQNKQLQAIREQAPRVFQRLNETMDSSELWEKPDGSNGEIKEAILKNIQKYYQMAYNRKIQEEVKTILAEKAFSLVKHQLDWAGFAKQISTKAETSRGWIPKDLDTIVRFAIAEAFYRSYKKVFGLEKDLLWDFNDKNLSERVQATVGQNFEDIWTKLGFAGQKTAILKYTQPAPINAIPKPAALARYVDKAMTTEQTVQGIRANEVFDSRDNPTLEVTVKVSNGQGTAKIPSGASTGSREALELRDQDPKYKKGKGVFRAINNVNQKLAPEIKGMRLTVSNINTLDDRLLQLDGTENKSQMGANAILGISMASRAALADAQKTPLYEILKQEFAQRLQDGEQQPMTLPVPMFNIVNGGAHVDTLERADVQEFMIMPIGAQSFEQALKWGQRVYAALEEILQENGVGPKDAYDRGNEKGFKPALKNNEQGLQFIMEAIERSGLTAGTDIVIALDVAASEFYDEDQRAYLFEGKFIKDTELMRIYENWLNQYPIYSIEDGFAENDWRAWEEFQSRIKNTHQLVGDDIFVTNPAIYAKGIANKAANAILVKLNQIGTVEETLDVIDMAKGNGHGIIISHRSGETDDTFIADLSVGVGAGQIKAGAPYGWDGHTGNERMAKYNRLVEIEKELGERAVYAGTLMDGFGPVDTSMASDTKGGINLDPSLIRFKIKRDARFTPVEIDPIELQNIKIDGFIPVIINITPVTNLPMLLGFVADQPEKQRQADAETPNGIEPFDLKAKHEYIGDTQWQTPSNV